MGDAVANMSRAAALVLCAGAACALAGPAGAAAGAGAGSLLGGLIGGLLSGAAGNFAHQLLDRFAGFFGDSMSRPTDNAPNHDLTILAIQAIRDTLSAAAGQLGPYDVKRAAAGRIAGATSEQIAATLASVPDEVLDDASILTTIGTPMGGSTTPTKTPAFWTFVAADLAKKVDAHHVPPSGLKGVMTGVKNLVGTDLAAAPLDPHADAAVVWVGDFLYRSVANQTNNILRGQSELSQRARHTAMFAFLRAILDAVQAKGSGVTVTDALRDEIRNALAAELKVLADEPAWFTEANRGLAASITSHATAITERLTTLGADTTAIAKQIARADEDCRERDAKAAKTLGEIKSQLDRMQSGTLTAASIKAKGNLAAAKVAPNRFFTGRLDELQRLHTALSVGSVAIVHALAGEGGIGKTELAKAYALIFAREYDGV